MESNLAREVKLLKIYAGFSTLVIVGIGLAAFRPVSRPKFEEIDVERINIVEPDGKLDLAITNARRFPPAVMNGKEMKRSGESGKGVPGMVFFNAEGEEQGGLAWTGKAENGKFGAGAALLFDQYKQDQTVGLMYDDDNGQRSAGMRVWDHPDTPLTDLFDKLEAAQKMPAGPEKDAAMKRLQADWGSQRVFVGKMADRSAVLMLADAKGRTRLQVSVDAAGNPKLVFLDENGKAVYSLPPAK